MVLASTTGGFTAFGWWWEPVKGQSNLINCSSGTAFDNTGPVPFALTVFTPRTTNTNCIAPAREHRLVAAG